jgi:hypothetical protein
MVFQSNLELNLSIRSAMTTAKKLFELHFLPPQRKYELNTSCRRKTLVTHTHTSLSINEKIEF